VHLVVAYVSGEELRKTRVALSTQALHYVVAEVSSLSGVKPGWCNTWCPDLHRLRNRKRSPRFDDLPHSNLNLLLALDSI